MALVWTLSLPVSFASGAMSPRSYSPQHPTPDTGMSDDPRPYEIRRLLYQHSRPTLKAMDDDTIAKLAKEILNIADGSDSPWTKWGKERNEIARRAADLWVTMEDVQSALNGLPGPRLTSTDVEQRIRAIREEEYRGGLDEATKTDCLTEYAREKDTGTEFIAILGYLEDWMFGAEERLRQTRERENRERIEREKHNAEVRLRSGADCPWTPASGVISLHCRKNHRLFRLIERKTTRPIDPKFEVQEVKTLDDKRGNHIGQYRTRTDATKAVAEVAFKEAW